MKKYLFILSVATLGFAACSNDDVVAENNALGQQPKEIALMPLTTPQTRAISNTNYGYINGTTFDQAWGLTTSAVDVANSTAPFFAATDFKYNATPGLWKGETPRYWPLSPVQVNFLAIAHANADNATGVTWTNTNASHQVQVVMSDNYAYNSAQRDFIYAIGNGQVTQEGNALSFPTKVDMTFKHTQAYLVFRVKAADESSENIAIKDIQIQGARTSGTATIARVNPATYANDAVSLNWTATGYPSGGTATAYNSVTPTQTAYSPAQALDDAAFAEVGHLLVVPYMTAANTFADGGFTTFKIIYTLNNNEYEYVYTPTATLLEAGKKYTYDITFKLHEIFINPSVTDWNGEGNTTVVYIPSIAYNESGATVGIGATAGYYTFTISDVPANGGETYSVVADGSTIIDTIEKTADTTASSEKGNITIKVKSKGGANNATETFKLKLGDTDKMTVTLKLKTTI